MTISKMAARWARAQSGVVEMTNVLAYAEGFSLVVGGICIPVDVPEKLARRIVTETLVGEKPWVPSVHSFPAHLCKEIRTEIGARIILHARMRELSRRAGDSESQRARTPWDVRLTGHQLGDLHGVEHAAHWTGEMMMSLRNNDAIVIEAGIKLSNFVHARLEPLVGSGDDEDTARLSKAALAEEPVVGADNKTN